MEQQIKITHRPEAEVGYQWVLTAKDDFGKTRICFATEKQAQHYVLMCALHDEII